MWTSLLSAISTVNNALLNEFKQKLDCGIKQKLKIQLEAKKDFYNEFNQMYGTRIQSLNWSIIIVIIIHSKAHINLIKSVEESFKHRILQILNGMMPK